MFSDSQSLDSNDINKIDPIEKFKDWLDEAIVNEHSLATAMTLSTSTPEGAPSSRMVLLKGVDNRGFIFYTNLGSRKSKELKETPRAALCFHWKSKQQQVRIEGSVDLISDEEADSYFNSRSREAKIGAWASKQSEPLKGRFELKQRFEKFSEKFSNQNIIPRPKFWSGYCLSPKKIEFWQEQEFRLHDRIVYDLFDKEWVVKNLYP